MAPASVLPPGGRARRLDGEEPQQSFSFVQPWGTSSGWKGHPPGGMGCVLPWRSQRAVLSFFLGWIQSSPAHMRNVDGALGHAPVPWLRLQPARGCDVASGSGRWLQNFSSLGHNHTVRSGLCV